MDEDLAVGFTATEEDAAVGMGATTTTTTTAGAADTTADDAAAAESQLTQSMFKRRKFEDVMNLKKQSNVDNRGFSGVAFLVKDRTKIVANKSTMWITNVVFVRPENCQDDHVDIETYVREVTDKASYIPQKPVVENAKYPVYWGVSYPIKEMSNNPVNARLRPGDVVEIIGLKYEHVWHKTKNEHYFSLIVGEIRAHRVLKAWDLVDHSFDVTHLTKLNAELSKTAVEKHLEAYKNIMGFEDEKTLKEFTETPNSPYGLCRMYVILPVDQAFFKQETECLKKRETTTKTVFNPSLTSAQCFVAEFSVDGTEEKTTQRVIRTMVETQSAPLDFLVKQHVFSGETKVSRMQKCCATIYQENLSVVPTLAEWAAHGPSLVKGLAGALVVTPKNVLVDKDDKIVELFGSLVWDLERTVRNVGLKISAEAALKELGADESKDVTGRTLDTAPKTQKSVKMQSIPLLHLAPHATCVNMGFLTGNVSELAEKAEFYAIAPYAKPNVDFVVDETQDEASRLKAYRELSVIPTEDAQGQLITVPPAAKKLAVFAIHKDVATLIRGYMP